MIRMDLVLEVDQELVVVQGLAVVLDFIMSCRISWILGVKIWEQMMMSLLVVITLIVMTEDLPDMMDKLGDAGPMLRQIQVLILVFLMTKQW